MDKLKKHAVNKLINLEGEAINMATYAKPNNKAFIVKPSKAREFINHSSKKDIERIYSIASICEEIFGKKKQG